MSTMKKHGFKRFWGLICSKCIKVRTIYKWMTWEEDTFCVQQGLSATVSIWQRTQRNKISFCLLHFWICDFSPTARSSGRLLRPCTFSYRNKGLVWAIKSMFLLFYWNCHCKWNPILNSTFPKSLITQGWGS